VTVGWVWGLVSVGSVSLLGELEQGKPGGGGVNIEGEFDLLVGG
jgi:hypothetical protein